VVPCLRTRTEVRQVENQWYITAQSHIDVVLTPSFRVGVPTSRTLEWPAPLSLLASAGATRPPIYVTRDGPVFRNRGCRLYSIRKRRRPTCTAQDTQDAHYRWTAEWAATTFHRRTKRLAGRVRKFLRWSNKQRSDQSKDHQSSASPFPQPKDIFGVMGLGESGHHRPELRPVTLTGVVMQKNPLLNYLGATGRTAWNLSYVVGPSVSVRMSTKLPTRASQALDLD